MIGIVKQFSKDEALDLVFMGLVRSTSRNQVRILNEVDIGQQDLNVYVLINPSESILEKVLIIDDIKVIILGSLPASFLLKHKIISVNKNSFENNDWERSPIAKPYNFAESKGYLKYTELANDKFNFALNRALERFDFTDEWNNLGYGRISYDDTIWSIASLYILPSENNLSDIKINEEAIATYSGIFDEKKTSILWFNRSVGPVDSPDWHLLEKFIASYRADELPCLPVLLEVPQSYDSAVTMRLDCDEDIESCRTLWQAYQNLDVPFSIAIHTTNLNDSKNHGIVKEMYDNDVSILSHTATHAPNWGGSYENALVEARESADKIHKLIDEYVKYAVAPFHQAPFYALQALFDSGYRGCIGGIIRNDPEFLIHSGGSIAGLARKFIGHSQQVMLHGECILKDDPLRIYKESFNLSKSTFTIFGFLDHPFSERYSYGWKNEEERALAHEELIGYIRSLSKRALFLSENDALDFIYDKSFLKLDIFNGNVALSYEDGYEPLSTYIPKVLYKNEVLDNLNVC